MPAPPSGLRRSVPVVLAGACTAVGLASVAPPTFGAARSTVPPAEAASVTRGVCTTSATDPGARAASFVVRMRATESATSYGFAVRLQERLPGARWTTLRGSAVPAGLGGFETARPGAPRMSRRLNVRGLHPGASYRLRVSYRWTTSGGERRAVRTSRTCAVQDLRPVVEPTALVGWQPSTVGGEVAYRVRVRAAGLDALRGVVVPVVVRQGTTVLATGQVRPAVPADEILLPGRRCTQGTPVAVQLDPASTLAHRVDVGETLLAACVPVS